MSNLEVIRTILDDKYKVQNKNKLIENSTNSKGKQFSIEYSIKSNNEIDFEVYKYDNENIFSYFSNTSGLKKMCDYIIFAEERGHLCVILVELKLSTNCAKQQLNAGEEFVNYIVRSAMRIGGLINNKNITFRKCRICESRICRNRQNIAKEIQFDNDDYCDYRLKALYLNIIMN